MSIRIPIANTNNVIARNFVKQMASSGFLPVIALEAFVESGRTYQAYKRGGFDEARERITEEFSGAVFWMGGVAGLNWVFEKLGQKLLKLPKINVSIARDSVRNPLTNYLENETTTTGAKILKKTMANFKFIKVISSVLIANAFIGFILPKINQRITRSYHKKKPQDKQPISTIPNEKKTTMDNFISQSDNKKNKKDPSFGGIDLLTLANKFESERNYKLLSVDAGTASGRAFSARNNNERTEILFRDLSSIYFYMFNMPNMNRWLNKLEQQGEGRRLDPVSADFATSYMNEYFKDKKTDKIGVEEFVKDFMGENKDLPETLKAQFEGEKIRTINLDKFKTELKNIVPADKLEEFEKIADKMSELQPQRKGISILTESQAKDILNGGHINNPEFLQEFYKNRFKTEFMAKYGFVAQKDLDEHKKELVNYINSIIKKARNTDSKEITTEMLKKASNHNLKMNELNWGSGFVVSALFLSTLIQKMQYMITKLRTGQNAFPGTEEYRKKGN